MEIQLSHEEASTIYASLNLARECIYQWIDEPGVDSDDAVLKVELVLIQGIIEKMDEIWDE